MANKAKATKKDYFNALRVMVENSDAVGEYTVEEVLEFIDTNVAQLDAKAAKAKVKAAEKKAAGDELRERVFAAVNEDWQTADDITEALGDAEVTRAKVVARLTQLEKAGEIVKAAAKTEDGKKRMVYRLAGVEDAVEE